MKVFQVLFLHTLAVATLTHFGSRNQISNDSNSTDARGGFPYPHSHRRRRNSEGSHSFSSSEFRDIDIFYPTQERSGKGSSSNARVTSDESVYPYIYSWHRSNEMKTSKIDLESDVSKAGYLDHHTSRQRRQSASDFGHRNSATTFRYSDFRGSFLNPRRDWHFRANNISLRTGSRDVLSNVDNSKGGYLFPHSCRRRRSDGPDIKGSNGTVLTRNHFGSGVSE